MGSAAEDLLHSTGSSSSVSMAADPSVITFPTPENPWHVSLETHGKNASDEILVDLNDRPPELLLGVRSLAIIFCDFLAH